MQGNPQSQHHKRLDSDLFSEIKANNAKIHNLVRLWIYMVEALRIREKFDRTVDFARKS